MARVCEIIDLLMQVSGATEDSKFPDDELLQLLEFGMSSSWQRSMTIQDFHPVDHSISGLVSFCEHVEATEPEDLIPKKKNVSIDEETIKPKKKTKKGSTSE